MVKTIFYNSCANIAASPTHDRSDSQEHQNTTPLDAIIPLIEEAWKDEEYAHGEYYDGIYSKLAAYTANLKRQRQRCSDPRRYQEIEEELGEVEAKLCAIALKFEASFEYLE